MINILKKEDCVGCMACVQRCPVNCISFHEDEQGFCYPKVNESLCVNCHLCEKVCPVISQHEQQTPLNVYAAENTDIEIRRSSSSGGAFHAIAANIIKEGGVVFGAKFADDWSVVHDFTETIDGLKVFQGSKYVQSKIGNSFQIAEKFLKAGRKVMFTGTPCQIAGLSLYLNKEYGQQLLKVSVICHGVPSPLVWREYLKLVTQPINTSARETNASTPQSKPLSINGISFRNKKLGWEKYSIVINISDNNEKSGNSPFSIFQYHYENPYFWAFNHDYTLRPSCFACPAKSGKSQSDLVIGDFWDIGSVFPEMNKKWGISLILCYNKEIMNRLSDNLILKQTTYQEAIRCVRAIVQLEKKPQYYDKFWTDFQTKGISTLNYFFRNYRFSNKQKFLIKPIKKLVGPYFFDLLKKYLHK